MQSLRFHHSPAGFAITIAASPAAEKFHPADLYTPVPYIMRAQLFAASLAEVKRVDADARASSAK
ncbi:MAG: hypothetical protein ACRD19_07215 [Terriglobia bacterium]